MTGLYWLSRCDARAGHPHDRPPAGRTVAHNVSSATRTRRYSAPPAVVIAPNVTSVCGHSSAVAAVIHPSA